MVYLLHFERPISSRHTCQHYIGYTDDLARRMQAHRAGNGARLVEVAAERGIGFEIVRVWRGDRAFERRLKRQHNGPRLCPICGDGNGMSENELTQDEVAALIQ